MATSRIEYLGDLRTKCTHLKSGVEIVTDAPVDNNGKGASFSPTDLKPQIKDLYVGFKTKASGVMNGYRASHFEERSNHTIKSKINK